VLIKREDFTMNTNTLESPGSLGLVRSLMSQEVVKVSGEESLSRALKLMDKNQIENIIITDDDSKSSGCYRLPMSSLLYFRFLTGTILK